MVGVLVLGHPAQHLLGLAGVRDQAGRIALAAVAVGHGSLLAGHLLGGVDDLLDGKPLARAEVEPVGVAALHEIVERAQMRVREIVHVDVVADARAVRRIVIRAEDRDAGALALDGLQNDGNEVRLGIVILADETVLGRTGSVEIAQEDALEPVGALAILAHPLEHELGAAVGIDGILLLRLGNRHLRRLAVSGARGREDELLRAGQHHRAQKHQRLGDIVLIVLQRILHGLAHLDEGGEVDDGVELAVHEQGVDDGSVAQVSLDELHFLVDDGGGMAVDHAVKHGDVRAALHQLSNRMGADVAGSACNEHFHDGWY